MEGTRREAPPTVLLAAVFGFVKAAFLGFMGIIGVAAWDDVSDPWGIGALVLAALLGLASFALLRGSRAARVVLAGLGVVGGVMALVYVFVGPTSAISPVARDGGPRRRGAVAPVRLAIRAGLLRVVADVPAQIATRKREDDERADRRAERSDS